MKQNLHTVLHAAKKYSVYSVHADFRFYKLSLSKIFLKSRLKKVCFLNWIKIACFPIEKWIEALIHGVCLQGCRSGAGEIRTRKNVII
jgi:hypothetical protein